MVDLERLKRLEAAATESLGPFEDGRTRAVELFEQALRNDAPALIAEIEALRRDKARLDWMLSRMVANEIYITNGEFKVHFQATETWDAGWWYTDEDEVMVQVASGRAAIDAAMPQPAPEVKP